MTAKLHVFDSAQDGLAHEHALFLASGPQITFWTAQTRAIVCPGAYERRTGFTEAVQASNEAGWPVHLRPTGGGAVPQGPGSLNMAIAFNAPKRFTIEDGYKMLTEVIKAGLGTEGQTLEPGETPGSFCDGTWNLSVQGQKIVGTAQRWRPVRGGKPRVLAHALILEHDGFQSGTDAVAAFHQGLGLAPVRRDVHCSLQSALGRNDRPIEAWFRAAEAAFTALDTA